jgi:hypothetical protein
MKHTDKEIVEILYRDFINVYEQIIEYLDEQDNL